MVPEGTLLGTEIFSAKGDEKVLFREAMDVAHWADILILCIGEPKGFSGESASRTHLDIPRAQLELLKKCRELGKKVVTLLFSGRPLVVGEIASLSDALLECWLPGTEGGHGIWDVLTGRVAPSGKLPMSFPRTVGQEPMHYNAYSTGRPRPEKGRSEFTSRYLDCPNEALYPFGYGLTYGKVTVGPVELDREEIHRGETLTASALVTNKGSFDVCQPLQLYIHDVKGSRIRPVRELKGFTRVHLGPGEEKRVIFSIGERDLAFVRADGKRESEAGLFELGIGLDSLAPLGARFTLLED